MDAMNQFCGRVMPENGGTDPPPAGLAVYTRFGRVTVDGVGDGWGS